MKPILKLFFLICAIANIRTGIWHDNAWHIGSKVLLMPVLILGVMWSAFPISTERHLLVAALFFSWIGDILLLSQIDQFIGGLVSFLIAHLLYATIFYSIWKREQETRFNWFYAIPVLIFSGGFLQYVIPYLNDMKIPVIVYALVISAMLILCLHAFRFKNKWGWMIIGGAILFIISDASLAVNKFTAPSINLGPVIMLTYALAQLYITDGMIRKNVHIA